MAAPAEHIHRQRGGIGKLAEENLVARNRRDSGGIVATRKNVEAVEAHPNVGVVDGLNNSPRVQETRYVFAPGERLVGNLYLVLCGQLAESTELVNGEGI